MNNKNLTKNEIKSKNIVLIITSILTLFIGISFFLTDLIMFVDGCKMFYLGMLLYFGFEFTNYLLTRKLTGMNSLYISLACLIASVSGLKYMNESINMVLSITLAGWMIMMVIIKLIKIDELRSKMKVSVIVNIFSMSLFILLGFLVITNLYKGLSNPPFILGFFFVANGILNILEIIADIKFSK